MKLELLGDKKAFLKDVFQFLLCLPSLRSCELYPSDVKLHRLVDKLLELQDTLQRKISAAPIWSPDQVLPFAVQPSSVSR
jgi:hypothetical protein